MSRFTPEGMCLDEYARNKDIADVFYKRATGALPEMESSKATAEVVAKLVRPGDSLLDVGCGAGHYLRSFQRMLPSSFRYTGVEYTPLIIEAARRAWPEGSDVSFRQGSVFDIPAKDGEFDVVVCSNLLMHVPTIVKPLAELLRVGRRHVVVRTLLGTKSFRIQEVYNDAWWPYTDVKPSEEFHDDGTPRAYSYENIYSVAYFKSLVHRLAPKATVHTFEDTQFSPQSIQTSADTEGQVNATRIVDGKQVFGYVLLPYHFAVIDLHP